ncbi:MAG: phosphate ABC transporter permease subunit PstC, partial [Desulfofustis sp.]|nr:phosphate ABC transporter permease subunit PstC [Desulfofustis sp.]
MIYNYLFPLLVLLGIISFLLGRSRAVNVAGNAGGIKNLHSLPNHYGMLTAISGILPALLI